MKNHPHRSRTLGTLRDTLLQKLLTVALSVAGVEKDIADFRPKR